MLTTILIEHRWMTTVALAALVLVGPPAATLLVGRPRLTRALLVVTVVVVLALTSWPSGSDLGVRCVSEWSTPDLGRVELMANIVLFTPPVALLAILTGRPVLALLVGSAASVLVEATQAFVTPLGRACSTSDWLYNTIGAALGALIAAAAFRIARHLRRGRGGAHPGGRP